MMTELGSCLLNESGRKMYAKEFDETPERTVEHPMLNRKVSYQYLLQLEAYKLKTPTHRRGVRFVPTVVIAYTSWWFMIRRPTGRRGPSNSTVDTFSTSRTRDLRGRSPKVI